MNPQFRIGWWALAIYLSVGLALEALHAFKVGWYFDAGNATRRLMFTLGHAHGTLLALVNIAAGAMPRLVPGYELARSAANALTGAVVILPLGFFLGGVSVHDGDPGIGVLLVPLGGLLLLYGVFRVAKDLSKGSKK